MSVTYKGNSLMSKSYGVGSKEGNTIKLNEDTIFRIGSVSKVFAVSKNNICNNNNNYLLAIILCVIR